MKIATNIIIYCYLYNSVNKITKIFFNNLPDDLKRVDDAIKMPETEGG